MVTEYREVDRRCVEGEAAGAGARAGAALKDVVKLRHKCEQARGGGLSAHTSQGEYEA